MDISTGAVSFIKKIFGSILGKLINKPLEILSKTCFQEAYRISTLYKSHRDLHGLCRNNLGEYVGYHINWNKLHLGKEQSTCTLWVKAKGNKIFRKLTFCVTASLESLRYQSVVTVFNANEIPCVVAIPSIPFRNIEFQGHTFREPYSEISIELIEVFDSNEMPVILDHEVKETLHPVDNLLAAMGMRLSNVQRWEKWWNLDFLEMEKKELAITLRGHAFKANFQHHRFAYIWKFLAWLGQKKWFLEICFWARNIFFASQLKNAFVKYLDESKISTSSKN